MQQMIFIADLIACSTCFGHHYAIIRSSRVLHRRLLPVLFGALVFKLSVWCGAEGYVSGLRAAATVMPETCWASNKIYNNNHLLHLVGILFPHIKVLEVGCFCYVLILDQNSMRRCFSVHYYQISIKIIALFTCLQASSACPSGKMVQTS